MKKLFMFFVLMGVLPLSTYAQYDDMYFVPSKKAATQQRSSSGYSSRYSSIASSSYQPISGSYNDDDIINFSDEVGVYPDSTGDFALTRQMTRFEGYTPSEAYWEGYERGRNDEWSVSSWHSPWYYNSYYPWYDSYWYGPSWSWHYSWYYDPWYYRRPYYYSSWHYRPYYYYSRPYYSYHRPYHSYGGRSSYYRPSTGTQSHGRVINSGRRYSTSGIGAGRNSSVNRGNASRSYNGSSSAGRSSSGSIGSSRSSSSYGSSRSSSGSIGAGRSSSGSIGSSRSYGGGGGGRSSGGGSRSAGRR